MTERLDLYTVTDFKEFLAHEDDIYGKCRPTNEFTTLATLGQGSSGQVFKGKDTKTNQIVALKFVSMKNNKEFPQETYREITNLRQLNHKNVIRLLSLATSHSVTNICLVLEYQPYNLEQYIEQYPKSDIPFSIIKNLLRQILSGVEYIHNKFVMHRDLKPNNILISVDALLKLTDFDSSKKFGNPLKCMTPAVGTHHYRAPEVLLASEYYGPAADMWSVGCILGELFFREPLFPGNSEIHQMKLIIDLLGSPSRGVWPGYSKCKSTFSYEFPNVPFSNIGKKFDKFFALPHTADFVTGLLKYDPTTRHTALEAKKHYWFESTPARAKKLDINFLKIEKA